MERPVLVIDRDIAQYDVFAEMFGDAQPVFSSVNVSDFLTENKEATEIEVEIRTDGGSTSEARVIFDMLRDSGKKIVTRGFKVNSSGVMIFLAGDERLIAENADFLIHPVWIDAMGLPFMLTGEDLQSFADEIKAEEKKLLDIYVSVIGEDKREEVEQLMKDSTNLTNEQAIRLGFATGKLSEQGSQVENKRAFSFNNRMAELVIKNKKQSNQLEMANFKETLESFNSKMDAFLNKVGVTTENKEDNEDLETKNASAELSEGGSVYFDGELAEGVALFTDETMETPAPDGEHILADGRVVTVADGMVASVAPASAEEEEEEVEEENKEVEELKNEVNELKETVQNQTESINKIAESMNKLTPAFDALQNLVPGDTGGEVTPTRKRKAEKTVAEMTNLEKKRLNNKK